MWDNVRMKTYRIPVTHTATTVVEHTVQAKNMQDAMFQLGQAISQADDPFECVADGVTFESTFRAGSPEIVSDDEQLDLKSDDEQLAEAEAS